MSSSSYNPASDPAMMELFRQEAESHTKMLTSGLLDLEKSNNDKDVSEQLMRSAHSIKGAARMVGIDIVVTIAHAMEDCFVAAQNSEIELSAKCIDVLLTGVDTISDIAEGKTNTLNESEINKLVSDFEAIKSGEYSAEDKLEAQLDESKNQDINPMLSLFQSDAKSILCSMQETQSAHQENITDNDTIQSLNNNLHTMSGGAKLCGVIHIHQLCKAIEKRINTELDENGSINISDGSAIATAIDAINNAVQSSVEDKNTYHLLDIANTLKEDINPTEQVIAVSEPKEKTQDAPTNQNTDYSIKISTQRLNRLVGLAGESVVESRWVRSHADSMLVYKRRQSEIINALDNLRNYLDESQAAEHIIELFSDIQKRSNEARSFLGERLSELDEYDRRVTGLSERLNHEVLQTRMRPFSDCTHGFDRMVRDLARSLDKNIELKIIGNNTQVDREILSRIEAPLNHIIRNSIDHGIETKSERIKAGKSDQATIKIEASHNMGMLSISISDDGHGVDMNLLRKRIIERKLSNTEMVKHLNDAELLDFLYLPGFSTRSDVTEISGRGVGLDVVHSTIQEMRGQIRTTSEFGKGIRIQLLLPLTLSVIRSLLVTIGGQAYAFPLARIESIHTLKRSSLKTLEGKQYFTINDKHIGLIDSAQVLEVNEVQDSGDEIPVIVLGDRQNSYGLVVKNFIGERDIAVHLLDPRLGKIKDISAATLLENGEPALIVDIEDMIRSIEILVSGERLSKIGHQTQSLDTTSMKRILVVDDSITVREVEKKLLVSRGYHVDVAVDGMDGWNTVHNTQYDLIISDIDMPRMNGIEFVTMLKADQEYRKIPVMIVSYKDRQEDREAGLKAGADYYLTKGSFHDESLIDAVIDLIGEAE